MKAVIQRVKCASVEINGAIKSQIEEGLMILLGVEISDSISDAEWLVNKILNMRIFSDEEGKMNFSVKDKAGEILLVSQFTLYASTKKGNRPSFIKSAKPDIAIPLYQEVIKRLNAELKNEVKTGEFGADMKVSLVNDGPVTIIIDSQNKE